MKKIIIVLIVLGGVVYGVLNYHFILMDDEIKILKKSQITPEYTYVDARGAKKAKLILNPALLEAGIKEILRDAGPAERQRMG